MPIRYYFYSLLILSFLAFATSASAQQVILDEDFEDGDFTQNPEWVGDVDHWTIVDVDGNNQLRLDGTTESNNVSWLSTESIANYGSWEFYVFLDGFVTSANNRAHVFIMSDQPNVTSGDVNGYAVRIGESGGDKRFRIVRYTNGSGTVILSGETQIEQNVEYQIRVERDDEGFFRLFVSEGYGSTPVQEGDAVQDNTHASSAYVGIRTDYTATRFDRFFFDDIIVTKNPLFLANVNIVNNQTFDVVFSEAVNPASVQPSAFSIDQGIGQPADASITQDNIVQITYNDPVPGGTYDLTVSGIEDLTGIPMETETFTFSVVDPVERGDVLINEFWYDLPDGMAQYVELFNASDKLFNLNEWRIQDNTSTIRNLTTSDYILEPGDFVVLTGNQAALEERFGDRPYLELPNFPSLNRVAADRIMIFTDDDTLVDSLRYEGPVWGGEQVALERISTVAPSHLQENWGESLDPLGGTPGLPNTLEPDDTPPSLLSLGYIDELSLQLRFDLAVNPPTAENAGNYSLSDGIVIDSAELTGDAEVTLGLSQAMISNTEYTLDVENVESLFGFAMEPESISVTFFDVVPVDSGDVFINEFMYDTAPGYSRYIELYNTSEKALSLAGWTTNNDTGNRNIITNDNIILAPESFVILAPDNTLLDIFPDIDLINMGSRFQALKVGGDNIVLRDSDGMLLDSLTYTPQWGGDDVALERISVNVSAYFQENWGDSPNPLLGTPGAPNEVEADPTPPELETANAPQANQINLIFSKSLAPDLAGNPQNYSIDQGLSVGSVTQEQRVIRLHLTSEMTPETTYSVTISNLTDLFGVPLEQTTVDVTFLEFGDAGFADVVINEFIYRPVTGETPRFIELYNQSDNSIDLQSWQLGRSITTISLSGPGNTIPLAPGEYLVITDNPGLLDIPASARVLQLSSMLAISQNGDSIFLRDDNGTLVDSLAYATSWGGSTAGTSLERLDPRAAGNDRTNWRTNREGNSAGAQNLNFTPNDTEPEAFFAKETDDGRIELRFNEFVSITGEESFSMNGMALTVDEFNPFTGNRVLLSTNQSISSTGSEDQVIEAANLSDVPGNVAPLTSVPLAMPVQQGDVVINEIMYQPISGRYNDFPDQSEYVEFYNRRDYAINLEGFRIHDEPDRDGEVSSIIPFSSESAYIPARGYAVIHADTERFFEDSRVSRFFEIEDGRFFFRADRTTLSLPNAGRGVYLAMQDGSVIDSVFYSPDWHNPNLVDERGISLERINPGGPSNDASNWGSSVVTKGGTPGFDNSLFAAPTETPESEGIVLEPNPFSPDGDGVDDNLFINYKLNEADYMLRVRIFDRYGRHVKTLADGKPAGLEGTLTWDGRRDSGQENRIGIYIIYFEAYNSVAGSRKTFRETVVLARRL